MNRFYIAVGTLLACAILAACSDQRVKRDDEVAMMIYRDCMGGMSGPSNVSNMSTTISNSNDFDENTSIAANTQTRQDQDRELECMRLAGWEK